jgi:hypothetical protein
MSSDVRARVVVVSDNTNRRGSRHTRLNSARMASFPVAALPTAEKHVGT